jgi:hypothetical protein
MLSGLVMRSRVLTLVENAYKKDAPQRERG